ncbi:radical SAM protein [Streptomyces sp. TRM 70351]|uniref:radical SAM protein n=1 Tax=Streptomyces sp. TRM 70351 TaxID=3116552 RepID=UPI002E7C4988|nr:radical SAM protein [Streptomyces sp. TRM 70351]MEE1931455.1 radical SAM protein [Streptomyces sp. TRM 70351]
MSTETLTEFPAAKAVSLSKLMLWMNSGCNARCRMCDIWREKPGTTLTVEEIRSWAPEWREAGITTVVMCGESLMHPDVWPVVAAIKEERIRVELLSNGLLLHRHAENVGKHCDVLRVSLDGPEPVHERMRNVSNAYERLRRGIAALHERYPDYPVHARCAVHKQNFRHLAATVETAKELGVHGITFSGTDMHNEEAFRRFETIDQRYIESLMIGPEELPVLEEEVEQLIVTRAEDFASGFIGDAPDRLRDILVTYYRSLNGIGRRSIRCNAPWTSAILEYDGTLRPCFPMPAYGNRNDHASLLEAVNSPGATEFRRTLDVTTNEACLRCVDQSVN